MNDDLAEQSVLSCCYQSPLALERAAAILTGADFHHWAHRELWDVLRALKAEGKPTDVRTVHVALKGNQRLIPVHLEIAREYGLDPAFELKAFKDRNEAKGGTYKNWDAAFRTWLNQAKTFRGGQSPTSAAVPAQRKHIPAEVPDHIDPNDAAAYAAWVKEATQ